MIDILELIGDGGIAAESSIILTYELDLPVYEGWVRRRLAAAGVVNQVMFCDLAVYQRELDGLSTTRHMGRSYSVTPVRRPGAFHPKVYLLLGRAKGRLLVGSGNVTIGGLQRNAELFGRFDYDQHSGHGPHPAFGVVVNLIEELASTASDVVRKQVARALSLAPWIRAEPMRDDRTLLVVGPGRPPLIAQLRSLIGRIKPTSAVVLSSSFDRKLEAVRRLADLTSRSRVQCIVQPDVAQLDGEAVKKVRSIAQWYPFVDPYPREKRKRKDVRAHAKLIVLDCGNRELVVYGSANSSRPALLVEDGNTEVVVAFWHSGAQSILKVLGLDKSLSQARIDDELLRKVWSNEDDDERQERYLCVLAGAVVYGRRIELTVSEGKPPSDTLVELAEGVNRAPLVKAPIRQLEAGRFEAVAAAEDARLARLVTRGGRPVSNFVAFTSPELAQIRGRSGIGSRAEAAIAAMQDGVVLGTVLFELLDNYRDFEVILARPAAERRGTRKGGEEANAEESKPRAVETFYTDATAGRSASEVWIGDRADLDLLASLVQPLRAARRTTGVEDEEEDDSAIDEEAERREIDAQGGRAAGDERRQSVRFASRESLERAVRRLAARLDRSAISIEDALEMRAEALGVRATSVARQIWMTHVAAFLAERRVVSAEGEEVRCLDAMTFARYVLRVCRAVAGGKDGGVLALVPAEAWKGPDADTLRKGLEFLWTCCLWAAAFIRHERAEERETIWEMVPELIAARFVGAVKGHCKSPDKQDAARRLPACGNVAELETWEKHASRLANLILTTEANGEPSPKVVGKSVAIRAGAIVFHSSVGVTAVVDREPWADGVYTLLDLSRAEAAVRKFDRGIIEIETDGWPVPWDAAAARSVGVG